MFLPKPEDATHKAWLYRTLTAIADDLYLMQFLRFKGGTCAALRGFLDRFSVDLDFDIIRADDKNKAQISAHLEKIFSELGLEIKDKSSTIPQYFLKYNATENTRNTIKVEAVFPVPVSNDYEPVRLIDIDRIMHCQTRETMFANKLVAILDRYARHGSIAGRDIYDIHHFFLNGYSYKKEIIIERQNIPLPEFFIQLRDFIEDTVTENIVTQDLNYLLTPEKLKKLRKVLKKEVLMFIHDELQRLKK